MYNIQPLPTLSPSAESGFQAMNDLTYNVFNKIVNMLKSIPVIPNSQGYFNSVTGEWLTPLVSFYDVLVGLLIVAVSVGIFMRFSNVSNIGGKLSSVTSRSSK